MKYSMFLFLVFLSLLPCCADGLVYSYQDEEPFGDEPDQLPPSCGDGELDSGEACDDGAVNSDTRPNACRTHCQLPRCGDGVVDSGEECDTGAATSTCSNTCVVHVPDTNTVRVFLLAGQSNMEGNNTDLDSLEQLICHANSHYELADTTCGSTNISRAELFPGWIDIIARSYNENPHEGSPTTSVKPVIDQLGEFLCLVGDTRAPDNMNCGSVFDLTDRFFATVSGFYCNAENNDCGKKGRYTPFYGMSTAIGLDGMATDGLLNSNLLSERTEVSVLQFTAELSSEAKLSLSERKGALAPGFASMRASYGPELAFGHYMGEALAGDLLLLKVVQGGTDLRVNWKTECSTKIEANDLTAEEKAQESLYNVLSEKATKVLNPEVLESHFPAYQGKKIEIAGFVWFQGWNDGGKSVNEANYGENLTCLINQLRTDLNLPHLPVVITQTHRGKGDGAVQVAQKQVAEEIGHAEIAITEDLSGYYHFDSAAHLVIGKRMAEAMIPLLPEDTAGECGCCVLDGICYHDCANAPESCLDDDSSAGDPPGSEGLPAFTYQGVALHPDDLDYSPKNDLIHPTIINTTEHIQGALGKYYLYYSPHNHIGISMAYADDLAGPWTEVKDNPVIEGPAAPDIRWIEEHGKFFTWAHSNNTHTDLWFTEDGIHFEKSRDPSTSIGADAVGTKNATYSRVYKRGIKGLNNKYIMLYSGLDGSTGRRHIWLAHSNNALHWTQLKEPLVEPAAGENGQIYGPSFVRFDNRNYIVYQDNSSGDSGGIIKYVEVDDAFTPVGADGERRILLNPPATAPINGRYRGAEFYQDGSTIYLFSGASRKGREIIVYATAEIQPPHWG